MLTRSKVVRFVKKRNKSDFSTNLQFQSDASDLGIVVKDFGTPRRFSIDGFSGYEWRFPVKGEDEPAVMVEFGRTLWLKGEPEAAGQFELMARAAYRPDKPPADLPKPDARRSGIKVAWAYYKSEATAQEAVAWAIVEAERRSAQGYDFGYQGPGSMNLMHQGDYAGMFEVCIP